MKRFLLFTLSILCILLGMNPAAVRAGTNVWASVGPDGGRVQAIAVASVPHHAVYKSTDGGVSWNEIAGRKYLKLDPTGAPTQSFGSVFIDRPEAGHQLLAWRQVFLPPHPGTRPIVEAAAITLDAGTRAGRGLVYGRGFRWP